MASNTRLPLRLLRIVFRVVWGVRALRFVIRRWWPAMQLRVGNHTMLLHPADNHTERFMWLRGIRCEAASIGRLTLLVSGKRALIFDVGANCGSFTLPLASAVGPGSRIVAFEPNPTMAGRLKRNLELNGLLDTVNLEEVAVGSIDDVADLHLGKQNLGESSLLSIKSSKTISVAVRPLTHYLPGQRSKYEIFVLKVDVEGLEDLVLVPFIGATSPKNMPDAILVETSHSNLWSIDPVALLKERGYISLFEGEDQNTLLLRSKKTPTVGY